MNALAQKAEPIIPSGAPTFECSGVVFTCFICFDEARTSFLWRSACGRIEVRAGGIRFPTDQERAVGAHAKCLWRAVPDGREISAECASIKAGMDLAVWTMRRGA